MSILQRIFFPMVAVVLALPGHARAEPGMACSAQTLLTCPGACVERCRDDAVFLDSHREQCADIVAQAIRDPASMDPALCEGGDSADRRTLRQCIEAAGNIVRPPSGDSIIDDFLSSAPDCAATPYALGQLYTCLAGEADDISEVYVPLVARGYDTSVVPGEDGDLPQVCAIPREQIDRDRNTADILTLQSESLLGEFSVVSACRRDWEGWLDAASDSIPDDIGELRPTIDGIITLMQNEVAPAGERELQIRGIVDGIQGQLGNIRSVMFASTLICPPA